MLVGGVLLASGMELDLLPGDYRHGKNHIRFLIEHVRRFDEDWVIIGGTSLPTALRQWTPQILHVRIASLKRCLALG